MALAKVERAAADVAIYQQNGIVRWNCATHEMLGSPRTVDVLYDSETRQMAIRGTIRGGNSFLVVTHEDDPHFGIQADEVGDVIGSPADTVHLEPEYIDLPEEPGTDFSSYVGVVAVTLPAF